MAFYDDLFTNQQYMLNAIADMIGNEQKRIVAQSLADKDSVQKFTDDYLNSRYMEQTATATIYSLHNLLKSVMLPGDFQIMASDFYKAPKIPYTGEKFYELPKKPVASEDEDAEEELRKALEKYVEENEEEVDSSSESMESDNPVEASLDISPQEALAKEINIHLARIAHSLGSKGAHEAAYVVEKAMRSIKVFAANKKLFEDK